MPRCSPFISLLALPFLAVGCSEKADSSAAESAAGGTAQQMVGPPSVDLGLPAQPGPRDAKRVIETVWKNLSKAGHACPRSYDYGANGGMRTLGCKLFSMVSYGSLGKMAGVPVFLAGPHTADSLDLENAKDFGRYNPAFVRWAVDNLLPAATYPALGIATRPGYDQYIRPLARVFLLVSLERKRDPTRFAGMVKEYRGHLERGEAIQASHEDYLEYMTSSPFRRFARQQGVTMDELLVDTTAGFWVRRAVDGTDHLFVKGLRELLSVYDGDFLRQAVAFAKNPPPATVEFDEMEGDYGEEPEEPIGAPEVTGDPIRDGWLGLGATRNTCSDFDYFPDGGMRIFSCHGFSLLSYVDLVKKAGVSPFISGPHSDGRLVLDHKSEFGHYNPAFVRWAVDNLVPGAKDDAFRNQTQALYDQKVRPLARTFMVVWRDIKLRPGPFQREIKKLRDALAAGSVDRWWYDGYYDYLDTDTAGRSDFSANGNVVKTCVAFWMRRTIEGTAEEFVRGLEKLMKAYDPTF